ADKDAAAFVGEYKPATSLLNIKKPVTVGSLVLPDFYTECRWQQVEALRRSMQVIERVGAEYGKLSGRAYGFYEKYKLDDAEVALVGLGSAMGTAKVAVDTLRQAGVKAGLLKLRVFRPFPAEQLKEALKKVPAVAVLDRSISYGLEGGPLFNEIRSAMYGCSGYLTNFIYGLGGRDVSPDDIKNAVKATLDASRGKAKLSVMNTIGLRGEGGKPVCV
ncbi:MAG: transketolase C-terminal domain-containing protein, partial [Planctomycetota bacterium]|nr:transketolase C-terminal domain-containing protein [Planctomycetota bacterium]